MDWKIIKRLDPGTCLRDVVFAGGQFVAVGDNGRVETSPDGVGWTVRNAGIGNVNLYGVAWGDEAFVAVGQDGYVLKSTDNGATWRVVMHPDDVSLTAVVWDGDRFVATGSAGKCIVSTPDGESWRIVQSKNGSKIESLASTPQGVLGAGNNGAVGILRGDAWTWHGLTSIALRTVAAHGDTWLAGGGASGVSELWRSTDHGDTWRKIDAPDAAYWMGIAYDGAQWMACGDGNVPLAGRKQTFLAHSTDGTVWLRDPAPQYQPGSPEHSTALGVAHNGKVIIVCGTRNMILSAPVSEAQPVPARVKYRIIIGGVTVGRINFPAGTKVEKISDAKYSASVTGQGDTTIYTWPSGATMEVIP